MSHCFGGSKRSPPPVSVTASGGSSCYCVEVEWLYCPHVLLDGKSPAECFSPNPEVVMAAAREEFAQDFDSMRPATSP